MFTMKADGVVFYNPSADDMTLQVLSPKAKYELNNAGELTFSVLPGNVRYDELHKLKTVVTLEQDGELRFRGRVLETVTDTYNQKEVYCEGELAFLLDSLVRPYTFKGKAADLFRQLVTAHNEQVEDYKRFEVGIITAVSDDDETETECEVYTDTLSEIKTLLLSEFDGYLRVRHEDGTCYLDYVDKFEQTCSQEINFGVNLVDIENKVNAQDVCTVLVPLGKHVDGKYTTIAEVNNGKDYIEDAEGIEKYGRIIKTHIWSDVEEPADLLALGQEYMEKMMAETTLTITAVDLHACGADVDGIHLGDTVKLFSLPHNLNKEEVCTAIDLDIEKPEKSEYTFGFPQETLTESTARTVKSFSNSINDQHRWLTETDTALNINVKAINLIGHRTTQLEIDVDAAESAIEAKANQSSVDILGTRLTNAELRIDGAESAITAKADQTAVDDVATRVTSAEANVDGLNGQITMLATKEEVTEVSTTLNQVSADLNTAKAAIEMKASTDTVDAMGKRLSSAELRISGAESAITAKADKIDLQGYVTMSEFEAVEGWTKEFAGESISASSIVGGYGDFDELVFGQLNGQSATWQSKDVVTGVDYQVETATTPPFYNAQGTLVAQGLTYVKQVIITPKKETINYIGYASSE